DLPAAAATARCRRSPDRPNPVSPNAPILRKSRRLVPSQSLPMRFPHRLSTEVPPFFLLGDGREPQQRSAFAGMPQGRISDSTEPNWATGRVGDWTSTSSQSKRGDWLSRLSNHSLDAKSGQSAVLRQCYSPPGEESVERAQTAVDVAYGKSA